MVLEEPVERVPVLTDSSELDSVCESGRNGSETSSALTVSDGEVEVDALICCFWAKAILILRFMASMTVGSRDKTLVSWEWTKGEGRVRLAAVSWSW